MKQKICLNCGSSEGTKKVTSGSFFIEVILWCAGLVPGMIYTVWRSSTTIRVCSSCGSGKLVPLNSPMGKKLSREMGC